MIHHVMLWTQPCSDAVHCNARQAINRMTAQRWQYICSWRWCCMGFRRYTFVQISTETPTSVLRYHSSNAPWPASLSWPSRCPPPSGQHLLPPPSPAHSDLAHGTMFPQSCRCFEHIRPGPSRSQNAHRVIHMAINTHALTWARAAEVLASACILTSARINSSTYGVQQAHNQASHPFLMFARMLGRGNMAQIGRYGSIACSACSLSSCRAFNDVIRSGT